MFDNKFNSKKTDPLVEAVKQAQADGDMRRQAIATVNEQFGVYSRNAVIRENLAAYDARIEETYKALKEGKWEGSKEDKDEDKKLAKKHGMSMKQWEKSAADKKHDAKEMHEGKKLADKDYDKDGKVESPKDEVWGSRFRAAKAAGKMNEEPVDYLGKSTVTQDRDTKSTSYDKTLPKEYPGAASSAPTAARLSNAKAAVTPIKEAVKKEYDDKDQSEHGVYKGKKKLGYVVKDKKSGTHTAYHGPSDGDYEIGRAHV